MNMPGFTKAQYDHDNAEPNDEYEPEITKEEKEAHKAYLFAMQLATDALSKQMELFKKYGKTDISDLLENEIQEITTEVARRELKFV